MNPMLKLSDEAFNAVMDRREDAIATVYSLRPGHTLTQADCEAIQLWEEVNREEDNRATDVFHRGYTQGLRECGSADIEKMKERLDDRGNLLAVEKAMRRFAEDRLDETERHVRDFIRALDRGYLDCKDDSAFIDALRTIAERTTSQAGSAGIGSPDAQPPSAVEPGAGVGGGE